MTAIILRKESECQNIERKKAMYVGRNRVVVGSSLCADLLPRGVERCETNEIFVDDARLRHMVNSVN